MKKTLSFVIVFALILAGFLHFYNRGFDFKNLVEIEKVRDLVPPDAVFLFEADNFSTWWEEMNDIPQNRIIENMVSFRSLRKKLASLDSLNDENQKWDDLFERNPLITSLHVISRNYADFIFYIPLNDKQGQGLMDKYLDIIKSDAGYYIGESTFQDKVLYEINDKESSFQFTYLIYENIFVGSFTSFLVEDVVRQIDNPDKNQLKEELYAALPSTNVHRESSQFYLNFSKWGDFLRSFSNSDTPHFPLMIEQLAANAQLGQSVVGENIVWDGFSNVNGGNYFLSVFQGQIPGAMEVKNLVPDHTAILYDMTISDMSLWQRNMDEFLAKNSSDLKKQRRELRKKTGLSVEKLAANFKGEIALSILESVNPENPEKLAFFKLKNNSAKEWNELAHQSFTSQNLALYEEKYKDHFLREMPIENLPELMLGPYFKGFEQCFYTDFQGYLIMANQLSVLKQFFDELEEENTWGRSVKHNSFLESVIAQTNFGIYVNTESAWKGLINSSYPQWRTFMEQRNNQLQSLDHLALQFVESDGKFYTSLGIHLDNWKGKYRKNKANQFEIKQTSYLDALVASKPFVVKSHLDGSKEVVLQDSAQNLYLLNSEGTVLWKKLVDGPLISDVYQLDFFQNSKLQFLFATPHALHILDRKGNSVTHYPLEVIKERKIAYLSLVDYDKSGRFRFLAADDEGRLYLYNKEGELLEGWEGINLGGPLSMPPFHIRISGKDCIVALQKNGKLHMLNRRGNYYPGFPKDTELELINPFFVHESSTFEKTLLSTITEDGLVVSYNLLGKEVERKQIERTTKKSKFQLCVDGLKKTFIIIRKDENKLTFFDQKGNRLFEKDIASPEEIYIQFYDFGTGNGVFAITDPDQEFTFLYNEKGKLMNYQPIESGFKVGLIYYNRSNQLDVYHVYKSKFEIKSYQF
ncbi:hypothetical protein [Xanthovirga aplysinae]|uniref:hypothetical protein n=1 Tax=Xanthovirga aplysinae TaxID=2529853 RepID=UPI0012BB9AB4|nr:hypothetical protein [Xanthovirga aplysinae]MTI32667.1 hypothetical protein [Xanthovirga aplysinae]